MHAMHHGREGVRRTGMRASHKHQPADLLSAAEALNIVAAQQTAQTVRDDRNRFGNIPTVKYGGQLTRRLSHVLSEIVRELQQVPPFLVTEFFHQIISQQTVLLQLEEVGDNDYFIQYPARFERI